MYNTTYVGLDAHQNTLTVATAEFGRQESDIIGTINNEPVSVTKMVRKLEKKGNELIFCYEAGQLGYGLYRQIKSMGHECFVIAPSLIPQKPGDRVKTDCRDARNLARCLRNGDLTSVWVPDEEYESLRDLVRARESAVEDLHRNRQRLLKFLLKLGIKKPEGINKNWTLKHRTWLNSLKLANTVHEMIFREHLHTIEECENKIGRYEKEIEIQSLESTLSETIKALQAFRGIALVTAVTIVAEVGDITRFKKATHLMSYAGLVPGEHSSGNTIRRGSITKAGNSHLRWIVTESAWHYRHRPSVGLTLKNRQRGISEEVKQISWKAQHRLNLKYRRMLARGAVKQKTITAVARELLGFIWAVGQVIDKERKQKEAA
jgi:transposase